MVMALFAISMTAMLLNKGTLLFITSHVNRHVLFSKECTEELNGEESCECGMPSCDNGFGCEIDPKIRWIWALYLCMITPYFFGFLRCLWKISFKTKKRPSCVTLLVVSTPTPLFYIRVTSVELPGQYIRAMA